MITLHYYPDRANPFNLPKILESKENKFSIFEFSIFISKTYGVPPYSLYFSKMDNTPIDFPDLITDKEIQYYTFIPSVYRQNNILSMFIEPNTFIPWFSIQNISNEKIIKELNATFHTKSFSTAKLLNYKNEKVDFVDYLKKIPGTLMIIQFEKDEKNSFLKLQSIGEKLRYAFLSRYSDLEITGKKIPGYQYPSEIKIQIVENPPPINTVIPDSYIPEYYSTKEIILPLK